MSDFECYAQENHLNCYLDEEAYSAVKSAWNHQQAKIDELQKRIDAMQECMDDAIRLIDEGNSWDAKELLK